MIKVKIHCPGCGQSGFIQVKENIVKNSPRGITAINVAEFLVCEHSFIVYIDKNFSVRDSFVSDFKIELPRIVLKEEENGNELDELLEDIDTYLITINISGLTLASILHALFYKKKVLLIHGIDIIGKHLMHLFEYIFTDAYDIDFTFGNNDLYKKNKKKFKDHVVFSEKKVLNDKEKIINQKKMNIELSIVQLFLADSDPKSNMILFKNEIYKSFILSQDIVELNKKFIEKGELTNKIMIDHFMDTRKIQIQGEYIKFLCEIIKNYFKVELNTGSDVSNFLGF